MKIVSIEISRLKLPLIKPYILSYNTFHEFEPYLAVIRTDDGSMGFGDAHISPGSSSETREGGWDFCRRMGEAMTGMEPSAARELALSKASESKVAATALVTALESLLDDPLLHVDADTRLPLLTPVSSMDLDVIPGEIEETLAKGFKTLKVKVGKDVEADLKRVGVIQKAVAGRATLRLDANRGFTPEQGASFASRLDPEGIELFEQPCETADWEGNAHVAKVSKVPLMLDEPICALGDIERAATIPGVGLCKLKLKRFSSIRKLQEGLNLVRKLGMEPVLGDGLGSEVQSWLEACVARHTIRNAGEFNGYLKAKDRIFENPLGFEDGALVMPAGYRPRLDSEALAAHTTASMAFGKG